MASEQGASAPLPDEVEAWLADHISDIEPGREEVLARAVESYRLVTETTTDGDDTDDIDSSVDDEDVDSSVDEDSEDDAEDVDSSVDEDSEDDAEDVDDEDDTKDANDTDNPESIDNTKDRDSPVDEDDEDNAEPIDDELISRLTELESRLDELEAVSFETRISELESDLDGHVEDLRTRIVEVLKEARSRAPASHDHTDLEAQLSEFESDLEAHTAQLSTQQSSLNDIDSTLESVAHEVDAATEAIDTLETETESVETKIESVETEIGTITEAIDTLESKADRLAGVAVDLRRRLSRVESHMSQDRALARLLETAAREGIKKADCESCGETVMLSLLAEPACPHCRSVFETLEAGSGLFKSASLVVADRPALEAGETTDEPLENGETTGQPANTNPTKQ